MFEEIYTAYAPQNDITFIMRDTFRIIDKATHDGELCSTSVIGWYYGEPNEENTQYYKGKLIATYE